MRYSSGSLVTNGAMTTNINSTAVDLRQSLGCSIQATVTAGSSPSGTLKLQGSNDNSNWVDVAGTSSTVSGNTSIMWNVQQTFYRYIRCAYAFTSGSGTLNVNFEAKGL